MEINRHKALFSSCLGCLRTTVQAKENQATMIINNERIAANLQKVKIDE